MTAIAVILLCAASGAVLGWLFPLDTLWRPHKHESAAPVPAAVILHSNEVDRSSSAQVEQAPNEQAPAPSVPLPEDATETKLPPPHAIEPARKEPAHEPAATRLPAPPQAGKEAGERETRKVKRASAKQRSRPNTARARVRRQDVARERPPPPRSIVSQLPIFGPVFGLLVP
jgi:hypothetical protein